MSSLGSSGHPPEVSPGLLDLTWSLHPHPSRFLSFFSVLEDFGRRTGGPGVESQRGEGGEGNRGQEEWDIVPKDNRTKTGVPTPRGTPVSEPNEQGRVTGIVLLFLRTRTHGRSDSRSVRDVDSGHCQSGPYSPLPTRGSDS